jgi:hypothetical protein
MSVINLKAGHVLVQLKERDRISIVIKNDTEKCHEERIVSSVFPIYRLFINWTDYKDILKTVNGKLIMYVWAVSFMLWPFYLLGRSAWNHLDKKLGRCQSRSGCRDHAPSYRLSSHVPEKSWKLRRTNSYFRRGQNVVPIIHPVPVTGWAISVHQRKLSLPILKRHSSIIYAWINWGTPRKTCQNSQFLGWDWKPESLSKLKPAHHCNIR